MTEASGVLGVSEETLHELIVSKRPTTDNNKAKLFKNYLNLVQIKIIGRLD